MDSASAVVAGGVWNLLSSSPAVAVGRPKHRDITPDTLEPDEAVHRRPLDRRLALELETELDKERDGGLEVVDNDADVVQTLKRHYSTY